MRKLPPPEYYADMSPQMAYSRARKLITCFAISCANNDTYALENVRAKYLDLLDNSTLENDYGLTRDITKHLELHMLSYDILAKISVSDYHM